jgi:ankyrin repeat protein
MSYPRNNSLFFAVVSNEEQNVMKSLIRALNQGHVDIAKLLVDDYIDMYVHDHGGDTPLHSILRHPIHLDNRNIILQLLIDRGADVNARNNSGDTPLHFAARNNHMASLEILIGAGADISVVNIANKTPLHYAVLMRHRDIASFLIIHGCDTEIRDNYGRTALAEAWYWDPDFGMIQTIERSILERDKLARTVAVLMGHHPRLGMRSLLSILPMEIIRKIIIHAQNFE